jgi:hypothetical protein
VEDKILSSTKQILDIEPDVEVFDLNIATFINSTFAVLAQLGIQEVQNVFVDDDDATVWSDLELDQELLSLVKTYVFLKVKALFDPPTTSFHIQSVADQTAQLEWRINVLREEALQ